MLWKMAIWTDHSVFYDMTIGMLALRPHIWTLVYEGKEIEDYLLVEWGHPQMK